MQIIKYITIFALVIVLHQTGLALFSPFLPVMDCLVWAEGDNPGIPETPPLPEEQCGSEAPQVPDEQPRLTPPGDELQPPAPEAPVQQEGPTGPGLVDQLHGGIYERLVSTAVWLDSFFGDERALKEENNTFMRLRYDVFREERSPLSYRPIYDVRLVLPQLEKKAHLVFSAEPATPPGAPTLASSTGAQVTPVEAKNTTAALHYIVRATPEESYIVRSGAQFSHGSPVLFVAPRYRSLIPLIPLDFRFTQELIYRTDTAWQAETQLDLERQLPHDLFFRTSLGGLWQERVNGYLYGLGFSLRQPFDRTHALQYEWTNSFQTRPIHELTEVALRIRYRQSFWREWLFFELAPQVRFPRDRNFYRTPGILFEFEMFFGRKA